MELPIPDHVEKVGGNFVGNFHNGPLLDVWWRNLLDMVALAYFLVKNVDFFDFLFDDFPVHFIVDIPLDGENIVLATLDNVVWNLEVTVCEPVLIEYLGHFVHRIVDQKSI